MTIIDFISQYDFFVYCDGEFVMDLDGLEDIFNENEDTELVNLSFEEWLYVKIEEDQIEYAKPNIMKIDEDDVYEWLSRELENNSDIQEETYERLDSQLELEKSKSIMKEIAIKANMILFESEDGGAVCYNGRTINLPEEIKKIYMKEEVK